MKCQEVTELAIRSEGNLPAAAVEHLQHCSECRQFCQVLAAIEPWGRQPSAELERRCRGLARQSGGRRRFRLLANLGWAAAAVLVCCCVFGLNRRQEQRTLAEAERVELSQEVALAEAWSWTEEELADLEVNMLLATCVWE